MQPRLWWCEQGVRVHSGQDASEHAGYTGALVSMSGRSWLPGRSRNVTEGLSSGPVAGAGSMGGPPSVYTYRLTPEKARGPLPPRCSSCALYRESLVDIMLNSTECLQEFCCWSQSIYRRVYLELRSGKLITNTVFSKSTALSNSSGTIGGGGGRERQKWTDLIHPNSELG